jgi:hypothetical protein
MAASTMKLFLKRLSCNSSVAVALCCECMTSVRFGTYADKPEFIKQYTALLR